MIHSYSINEILKGENFRIDVSTLQGNGSFPCPKCGQRINPDDETDENYVVFEPRVINDTIIRLTLHCLKCHSLIELFNFPKSFEAKESNGDAKT